MVQHLRELKASIMSATNAHRLGANEAQIVFGGLARSHQQDAGVCTQ